MGVGMPGSLLLHEFGSIVWDAFGNPPFHVGSSVLNKRDWRDVDVRMILSDEEWDRMGLGDPKDCQMNPKWRAFAIAFSALGKQMTGLPIDFQLQRMTEANTEFGGCVRSAIGIVPLRIKG